MDRPLKLAALRRALGLAEGRWFDATRHVDTCGSVALQELTLVGAAKSGHDYMPARPGSARRALAELPLKNPSNYTFVDLGSGKGRIMFLAAEFPFRRIQGVEFAVELHNAAQSNIRHYRYFRRQCTQIESVNMDASDYDLPNDNLVLHLFNPFGAEVLEKVLANLAVSLREHPRHVIVIMLFPEFGSMLHRLSNLKPYRITNRYQIFQT
jgi:predicted RNA methylase